MTLEYLLGGGVNLVPYYLLKTSDFNVETINHLSSSSQLGLNALSDDTPFSSIQRKDIQNISNFICYDLKTEILKRQKGRAYGNPQTFNSFILIKDDLMFYNPNHNLLILSTSKDNFYKFTKRFDNNNVFTFNLVPINFDAIINDVLNLGTDGVWLGNLENTNINAIGLIGHKIQDSNEYQKYIETGAEITNISFVYNFNGKQEKIMISRDGGIILYQSKPTTDALELVIDVFTKMLLHP